MKGNNTIELNQSTMNEAIQYWLHCTQLKMKPIVTDVSQSTKPTTTFFVSLKEEEEKSDEIDSE